MRISFRDRARVVRAMEIFLLTDKKVSDLEKDHGFRQPVYDILRIGLRKERNELYAKINERVEEMLTAGLGRRSEETFIRRYERYFETFFEHRIQRNTSLH